MGLHSYETSIKQTVTAIEMRMDETDTAVQVAVSPFIDGMEDGRKEGSKGKKEGRKDRGKK